MPLPWTIIFFAVFLCFFTITFLVSFSHLMFVTTHIKKVNKSFLSMPW